VNDPTCNTVSIDTVGPDESGSWFVTRDIVLRSNLVIESGAAAPARLTAIGGSWQSGFMRIDGQTNVTIRRLDIQNNNIVPNGIRITGSRDITVTRGTIAGALYHGVHVVSTPSFNVTISEMTLEHNGLIDVRSDTANHSTSHSRVLVTNNSLTTSGYGVALADCGDSSGSACEVRGNVIASVSWSGVDLNRSHYAIVAGNDISGCRNGITVDDARNGALTQNTVRGCVISE